MSDSKMGAFRNRFAILGIAATVVMVGLTIFLIVRNVDSDSGGGTPAEIDPVLTEWWRATGRDLLTQGREAAAAGVEEAVEMRYCIPGAEFVSNRCDELGPDMRGFAAELRATATELDEAAPPEKYSQAWATEQVKAWRGLADSFDRYAEAAEAGYEAETVNSLLSGGHQVDTLPADLAYATMLVRISVGAR